MTNFWLKIAATLGPAYILICVTACAAFALNALLNFLARSRRPILIAFTFVVVGVGAYAASFVADMVGEALSGQLSSANILWPCITWSFISICSLAVCARRPIPFLARTGPFLIFGGMAMLASLVHSWNLVTAIVLILGGVMYGFFAGQRNNANPRDSLVDGSNGGLQCHTTSANETAKPR
jgi:hypothetical protein